MKRKTIKQAIEACCVIFCLTLVVLCGKPVSAAVKFTASEDIAVQKGKTYRLKDFLSLAGTRYSAAKELNTQIKKGKKISVSGKGITVQKKKLAFKVKKTGKYRLKVKTKKKTYVFLLHAVNPAYELKADEITEIKIWSYVNVPPTGVEIKDAGVIRQYVEKVNQAGYTFSEPKTLRVPVGFCGYIVELYDRDGNCIQKCELTERSLTDTTVYNTKKWKTNYIIWKSKSDAGEFYQYVGELFQSLSSGI